MERTPFLRPFFVRLFSLTVCGLLALSPSTPLYAQAEAEKPVVSRLRIVVLEGDNAINTIRMNAGKPPVVRLEDDQGQPIEGVPVTFLSPDIGAGALFSNHSNTITVATDSNGLATAHGMRPNNVAGAYQIRVTASFKGEFARTALSLTNVIPASNPTSVRKWALILGLAGGAALGATLALAGGSSSSGNSSPTPASIPNADIITPGSPVWGPPR